MWRASKAARRIDGSPPGRTDLPAVLVNVQRQPGANVIEVVDRVQAMLPQLSASLPAAVELNVLTDRTQSIRASVTSVQHELIFAVGLVVLVTFLFLRNVAATIIPSIAVPLSLIGTFGVMYLAGFSLNILTLMALTIATGFVVDDAIVMMENIARYREEGASAMEAALKGASQIGFTLVSLTLSLIAVLIPLLFMGDVVGRLFHEFAITLAVSIMISLVVSLTLTPMMCARMLPEAKPHRCDQAQCARPDHRQIRRMARLGVASSTHCLARHRRHAGRHRRCSTWSVPKGFFPVQDNAAIQAVTEAPQSISFSAMSERQQALGAKILEDPAVRSLSSFIGVDGTNATLNSGRMLINLKPHGERSDTAEEIIERLRVAARDVAGITLYMQPVQELTIEDRVSRTQFQFMLTSPDEKLLHEWVPRLVDHLREIPALRDVASDLQGRRLASVSRNRSRCREPARYQRRGYRRRPLQRIRPAADFHAVHAGEPVPRRDRSGSATRRRAGGVGKHLRHRRERPARAAFEHRTRHASAALRC